jgi:hypothetical protein
MLVWQNRLSKNYKFEFVAHEITSTGVGGIQNRYKSSRVASTPGAEMFQLMLGYKKMTKAKELLNNLSIVDSVDFEESEDDGLLRLQVRLKKDAVENVEEKLKEEIEATREKEEVEKEEGFEDELEWEFEMDGEIESVEMDALVDDDVKLSLRERLKRRFKKDKEFEEMIEEIKPALEVELDSEMEIELNSKVD